MWPGYDESHIRGKPYPSVRAMLKRPEWRPPAAANPHEGKNAMHALAEPPVSPTVVGTEGRDGAVVALDQRRVVVRLRDGETILVGGSPSYEDALVLAQKTILKLAEVGEGEWPMLGDRFINPDAIVSVDVLRWL